MITIRLTNELMALPLPFNRKLKLECLNPLNISLLDVHEATSIHTLYASSIQKHSSSSKNKSIVRIFDASVIINILSKYLEEEEHRD